MAASGEGDFARSWHRESREDGTRAHGESKRKEIERVARGNASERKGPGDGRELVVFEAKTVVRWREDWHQRKGKRKKRDLGTTGMQRCAD